MNRTTKSARTAAVRSIRAMFHARPNLPVYLTDDTTPPSNPGHGWRYETRGGTVIDHPSAYSRRGWSNMVYVGSTDRIEVGRAWLKAPQFSFGSMVP
jgi:hypothetical protein